MGVGLDCSRCSVDKIINQTQGGDGSRKLPVCWMELMIACPASITARTPHASHPALPTLTCRWLASSAGGGC